MTQLERSLLYRVDWTHNRIQDLAYTIQFWFWCTEYAAIVVTVVWTRWGWYGLIHSEYRTVGKRRGTGRASRAMYRDHTPRIAFYSVEATLRMSQYGGGSSSIVLQRPETYDNGFTHPLMDRDPGYWDNPPALMAAVPDGGWLPVNPGDTPGQMLPEMYSVAVGTAQVPPWSREPDADTVLFYPGDLTGTTIEGNVYESESHRTDAVSRA